MKSAIDPRRFLQSFDRQVRNLPTAIPGEARRLPEHGCGASRDRVRHEFATVDVRARVGREGDTGLDTAAVGGDAARKRAKLREQRGNVGGGRSERGHGVRQVSSRISAPSGGRITLLSGASVGTPSIRNAEPVTFENTGAATAPP